MKIKKRFKMPTSIFLAVCMFFLSMSLAGESLACCQANYCSSGYSHSVELSIFMADLLLVLFAMLFWFVSPIGILFLLGVKLFFSENASVLKKKFALLLQFLSFLSWFSLMFIFLVVYIDSVSYEVLNLGGDMLNLAIKSGFGFMIFMIMLAIAEKKMIFERKHNLEKEDGNKKSDKGDGKEKNNGNSKNKEKKEESIKIAGIEVGGIKGKVKRKIKEEIKEIVDKEIDKRL